MRALKSVVGFLIALGASTLIPVVTLSVLLEGRVYIADILSDGTFVLPLAFLGGLLVGLPVYLYGRGRGWFDTLGRSAVTGAVAGSLFALAVFFLVATSAPFTLILFFASGAVTGSIAGAIWWAFVARTAKPEKVV